MADNDPALGNGRWVEKTVLEIFQDWTFLPQLEQIFLKKSSANTDYLKKSDASSTYLTQSNASSTYLTQSNASSTYATKSELATKQDSIPNFSLISSQTAKGMTVKVYSDGLNVYVTYEASPVTGLNTSSTNSGVTDILTISNTNYAPKIQTQVPARGQADTHRIRITGSGVVQFLNGSTSATSYTVSGALYYPLKSRIP